MMLPFPIMDIPTEGENSFGAIRKYDIHTGVDLFCVEGQQVCAMESGIVINVLPFTGSKAESPWWLDTDAIMIEGKSGVILYGEVNPSSDLKIGDYVAEGEFIGNVMRVLKNDKSKPTTMLHLELYKPQTNEPVWWCHNDQKPEQLLDPTQILINVCLNS